MGFVAVFFGSLEVQNEGTYTFCLESHDGYFARSPPYFFLDSKVLLTIVSYRSKLFVDKKLVVDNDGRRGGLGNKCAAVDLAEGQHPTRVEFFRGDGQASVRATYRL
jgi:hypothetical protein